MANIITCRRIAYKDTGIQALAEIRNPSNYSRRLTAKSKERSVVRVLSAARDLLPILFAVRVSAPIFNHTSWEHPVL